MSVSLALTPTPSPTPGPSDDIYLAVGSPVFTADPSYARVFAWNAGSSAWVQMGADIVAGSTGDRFGTAVSLSATGATVIVAIGAPDGSSGAGYVQVFSWTGAAWVQLGSTITGASSGDFSGTFVSLSSTADILAVGEPGFSSNKGRVRVYMWDSGSTSWLLHGSPIVGTSASDQFGTSVSISNDGNRLVVGAPNTAAGAGLARVFQWNGIDDWEQLGIDIPGVATLKVRNIRQIITSIISADPELSI